MIGGPEEIGKNRNAYKWHTIQQYVVAVHNDIHSQLSETSTIEAYPSCQYTMVAAMQQVVNGMNYWVRVDLCDGTFVDIYLYVPIGGNPQIEAMQYPRTRDDPLTTFRVNDISSTGGI